MNLDTLRSLQARIRNNEAGDLNSDPSLPRTASEGTR
jgi:hypothetical protein